MLPCLIFMNGYEKKGNYLSENQLNNSEIETLALTLWNGIIFLRKKAMNIVLIKDVVISGNLVREKNTRNTSEGHSLTFGSSLRNKVTKNEKQVLENFFNTLLEANESFNIN